ncbi:MAG TPA: phage holin family protein [Acidimicrobiales bacterium]|nr:phage holin family protein [Acidimicrobiales bacterium]
MAQPGESPSAAPAGNDWSVQAADTIERFVGTVRDKTSVPLTTVARALVFGLVAAVMGLTTLAFVTIAAVRLLNVVLPGDVWAAYLVVGGIFTVVGLFLLRRATSDKSSRENA